MFQSPSGKGQAFSAPSHLTLVSSYRWFAFWSSLYNEESHIPQYHISPRSYLTSIPTIYRKITRSKAEPGPRWILLLIHTVCLAVVATGVLLLHQAVSYIPNTSPCVALALLYRLAWNPQAKSSALPTNFPPNATWNSAIQLEYLHHHP